MGDKSRIMRLAIIGGRDFTDMNLAELAFGRYFFSEDPEAGPFPFVEEIISGGAAGADRIGKQLAKKYYIDYVEFPAKWDDLTQLPCSIKYKNGKPYNALAGFNRNKDIIDNCDMVLAFWNGMSKGTANSLSLAKKAKKDTIIIYY